MKFSKDINDILCKALQATYELHEELGEKGEETVEKNQFGETALRVDVEAEEVVLQVLKEAKVPIRVISEEHGQIDITDSPIYLGVLDGLDGTNRYIAGRGKERYGTMFAIFSSLNPQYNDYITGGIMEHTTGKLFTTKKGDGSFVTVDGEVEKIYVSSVDQLNEKTRIYLNQYWAVCRKMFLENFGALKFTDPRAYSTYFSDLASGGVDLVISSTGKNNLELAIGYGLIVEAGGVVVDVQGESLRDKKYLEFGQNEQIPIIASSCAKLAQELLTFVGIENS
jgi:fructose-1,6-bisphosphatase/inositol monophosphatase family enzyme